MQRVNHLIWAGVAVAWTAPGRGVAPARVATCRAVDGSSWTNSASVDTYEDDLDVANEANAAIADRLDKIHGIWDGAFDAAREDDAAAGDADDDPWCAAEEPAPHCVDADRFWDPVPISTQVDEDDPWCDVEVADPDCVDAARFHDVDEQPAWGDMDSHEVVAVDAASGAPAREAFTFVDERACVGCNLCAAIAPATFYMEDDHGMARVYRQHGDADEMISEAVDACPVGCIKSLTFDALVKAETDRRSHTINQAGRLAARAEGRAPRTILEGLVDTDDPAFVAREKAREKERLREGLRTLAGSKHRLVEL